MLPCLCWLAMDLLGPGSHEQAAVLGPCSAAQQSPFPWHSTIPVAPRQELSHEQPASMQRARVCLQPAVGTRLLIRGMGPDQGHPLIEGTQP